MGQLCYLGSGVGQGGGAGGATAPPLFGHVCTLNERKGFLLQYVSHKCWAAQSKFLPQIAPEACQSTKTRKKFLGGMPPDPLNQNKKSCPPTFHDLPTPLLGFWNWLWLTKLYKRSEYNLATKGQFQNLYSYSMHNWLTYYIISPQRACAEGYTIL